MPKKSGSYEHVKKWRSRNRAAHLAAKKKYYAKHKERLKKDNRRQYLKRTYNLSEAEYEKLFVEQQGLCAICRRVPEKIHIDHCHATNRVRGILCPGCNLGLGHFAEDPERLSRAIDYLARN